MTEASALTRAFQMWGHLAARLDPFGRLVPVEHPALASASGPEAERLRAAYCGPIGVEVAHISDTARWDWIGERMEGAPPEIDERRVLARIAEAETFERFLHQRYVGTKRYSLEGAAALVPLLDTLLEGAPGRGAERVLIGMSHRGRLNVMAHIVGIPPASIFAGFEDVSPESVLGGGDVAYHHGATGRYEASGGRLVDVHLVSNPSHLEAVNPVLIGRTRAWQERLGDDSGARILSINLHGDAAFAGQGIAAETLNLSQLPGFSVGGTMHVVVNNLIGFTTAPESLHSSRYATDVAKRLEVPILHVNGEEPLAVVRAAAIAIDYRAQFGTDVVIDLICYRRYGHSEVDDPTITQPELYRQIKERPLLWRSFGATIGVTAAELDALEERIRARLTAQLASARAAKERPVNRTLPDYWAPYRGGRYDASLEVATAVPAERLAEIARVIASTPEGFHVHPKVAKGLAERVEMGEGRKPVDWGMAELLAFGSLLWDGIAVRLAGEDSRRGTFNQRHAVLFDYESGAEHTPLQHLHAQQGRFDVYDTALSEAAALGFEYGFSREFPDGLALWEAQFGDFVNGAQVIIDQFLAAGEDKWQLLSGLVLLLPHGYEGQGPEHSSARFERFLQLAGEDNIQVCQPGTAAQYFHLLRRQVLRVWRKPLVVLTPKGMLRVAAAASPIGNLAHGGFETVCIAADADAGNADRILVCSGRVAHDLRAERDRAADARTAILALDQLVPFPDRELRAAITRYDAARELVWVQEEPANMGALSFVRPRLERIADGRRFTMVKRPESASPATGSHKAHDIEQQALLQAALARPKSSRG
jgi:2-oxoglutarate dehydrogenase E1 component